PESQGIDDGWHAHVLVDMGAIAGPGIHAHEDVGMPPGKGMAPGNVSTASEYSTMTWPQDYDPLHSWPLSTLISALPVVTLFFALVVLKLRVWAAALAGLLMAVALAIGVFGMPAMLVAAAGGLGVIFGLLRIAWIIVASIFLYNIAVETGQFQVM